jgi:putative endonuclease
MDDEFRPAVYIRTNVRNAVLYVGVTRNLYVRDWYHRQGKPSAFVTRYKLDKLVWYQEYQMIIDAIAAEKRLKAGSRQQKIDLVNQMNPQWLDLAQSWR